MSSPTLRSVEYATTTVKCVVWEGKLFEKGGSSNEFSCSQRSRQRGCIFQTFGKNEANTCSVVRARDNGNVCIFQTRKGKMGFIVNGQANCIDT